MVPNDKAFDGKSSFQCNGRNYYRWHNIRATGDYRLHFRIVQTNSPYKQGIALFLSKFKGTLALNGKRLPVLKGKFAHYIFKEDWFPDGEFMLSVHSEEGNLVIGNASERPEVGSFTCGAFGCAFWIESLNENTCRFYCNDHEYDEDFDDFVFDMSIECVADT